jgi:phosphoribosyl 1,2-cyclic phosphate phosphodiesterase
MIETQGKVLVIDSGPDFRQQMLRENVTQLDGILFTHEHKDHVGGLDDVRAFNYFQQRDMNVYCNDRVRKSLENEFHYAFADFKYPGVPEIAVIEIENQPFVAEGISVIPIEGLHHKLTVQGFRIGDFVYLTDMNYISETEQEKIKGAKVIVITALRQTTHISHFSMPESLALLEKWQPERGYLIHASHQLGAYAEVQAILPPNITLAYDGLKIVV